MMMKMSTLAVLVFAATVMVTEAHWIHRNRQQRLSQCFDYCKTNSEVRTLLAEKICPDACDGIHCSEHGTCSKGRCTCDAGYMGCDCETFDRCSDVACANNGTCKDGLCTCSNGFSGTLCEIDPCDCIDCKNQGICVGGKCQCYGGFEGEFCETVVTNCMVFGNRSYAFERNGICVWIPTVTLDWKGARQACKDDGGSLIVPAIVGAETLDELLTFLRDQNIFQNIELGRGRIQFIGGSDIETEGIWKWVDGTDLSTTDPGWYTSGSITQPNGGHSDAEDCLVLSVTLGGFDSRCTSNGRRRFICGGTI